jgi:hypothetical protein
VALEGGNEGFFVSESTTAEPEVITPVAETAEPVVTGDTDAPPADAAPVVDPAAEWAAYQASKEGTDEKTPEPVPSRYEIDSQAYQRDLAAFRTNFGKRQQTLDGLKTRLVNEANLSTVEADYFITQAKNLLNEHHADSLRYAGNEMVDRVMAQEQADMREGLTKVLPKDDLKAFDTQIEAIAKEHNGAVPYDSFFKTIHALAFKAGAEAGEKKGFDAGVTWRESKSKIAASGEPVKGSSPALPPGSLTAEDASNLPIQKLIELRARQAAGG